MPGIRYSVVAAALVVGCAGPSSPHTIVSLTFDDTFADQAQVGDLVAARGMHATFFVNSGRIGLPSYMTAAQLLALQAAGNEIAGHTVSHPNLPTLDLDEARRQICDDRVQLLASGFAVTTFAYPFGATDPDIEAIVAACGYSAARGVGGLASGSDCADCAMVDAVPPADRFEDATNDSIQVDTSLATLEGYVTQAEGAGGGWLPIVMHHVCAGCDSLSVNPDTLGAFLDWLAARAERGTTVATIHEVLGGAVLPGVPGPAPSVPIAADGNLLQNPSLERDGNGDGVPDCWERSGTGSNAATYALTSDAAAGAVAQRITMTTYASGARRLLSSEDLGSCAPSATPGHRYAVSLAYIASAAPRFTAYYRTAAGGWLFFAQSEPQPPAAQYARARWVTPPVPAGATALSVGLSLESTGTLTTDAYDLRDAAAPSGATP